MTTDLPEATDPAPESAALGAAAVVPEPQPTVPCAPVPREIGGREGPEPTRYGDWERAGRCIDF